MDQLQKLFQGVRVVATVRNPDGTTTLKYSDGSEEIVTMTDGPGSIGIDANTTAKKLNGAGSLAAGVANGIFNPFDAVIKSFHADTPEGIQLRADARKFGLVSILLVLGLMFLYLTFKDS